MRVRFFLNAPFTDLMNKIYFYTNYFVIDILENQMVDGNGTMLDACLIH